MLIILISKEVPVVLCSLLIVLASAKTGIGRISAEKNMLIKTYYVAKSLHQPVLGRKLS